MFEPKLIWRVLLIALMLCFRQALAQSPNFQTLKQEYDASRPSPHQDSLGVELLNQYYYTGNLKEGIDFAHALLQKIDTTRNSKTLAQIHNRLGTIYTTMGSNEVEAFFHLNKSLEVSKAMDWKLGLSIAYNNIGNIYRDLKYHTKAHEYYILALNTCIALRDSVGIGYAYKNLGILFEDRGWEVKALEYHQLSYDIRKKIGNPREILSSLTNIGTAYNSFHKYDKAIPYLKIADSIAKNLNSEIQTEIHLEMGDSYYYLNQPAAATYHYDSGLKLAILYKKTRAIANILNRQANTQFDERNYQEATKLIEQFRMHLDSVEYATGKVNYYKLAYKMDSLNGDEHGAMRNFRKMADMEDSLATLSSAEELMLKQNAFELMQKDAEIQIEKEKQQFQRLLFLSILISLLIISLLLAFAVYQKIKSVRKINENNQRLKNTNEELATTLESLRQAEKRIQEQNEEIKSHNISLVEQVKARTDEIMAATSQVAQFSFLVSHNLRGPVARILGLRNLLKITQSEKELTELLEKIDVSIGEVDSVIREINEVLGIESGVKTRIELIETEELIETVLKMLQSEIDYTQAKITYSIGDSRFFFSSSHYLRSVLEQLLLNSMKFRNETKDLTIDIAVTSIAHGLQFTITDNGLGVDIHRHAHEIFTPYKRFHTHRTGRGFNLFMSKHRIETLGGTIRFESEPNRYTRITFTIPGNQQRASNET